MIVTQAGGMVTKKLKVLLKLSKNYPLEPLDR